MKNTELKNSVISLCNEIGIHSTILLFKDIVSQSTIYRWLDQSKTTTAKDLVYNYTPNECLREWEILNSLEGNYNSNPRYNKIILTHQPHFYAKENELFKIDSIRNKLIENRKKFLNKQSFNDKELLRGFKISGIHIGYSHFSPLWIKKFITDNNIKSIYDPCGGWGHRMLGALVCNIQYIYNDIWDLSVNGITNILSFLSKNNIETSNIHITNNDCTKYCTDIPYESIFTCPPYYNIEKYNQPLFNSISHYNEFIYSMLNTSIKDSVNIIGIIINNTYSDYITDNCNKFDFKLDQKMVLQSTKCVSHFNKNSSKKSETLLIFKR